MRIHEPQLTVDGDTATFQARIELAKQRERFPDCVWFKFPRHFEPLLAGGAEPFVVGVSSLASLHNEPIVVTTPISERLSVGLEEYWNIFSLWFPGRLHPVELSCSTIAAEAPALPNAATLFSGGVDSFFTLYRGLDRPPTHRVRYALFIHGFDIPLSDRRTYEAAAAAYERSLGDLGVELIRVETNLRAFIPNTNWELGHGSALIGTALTLAGAVRRFYVPSSKSYTTLEPHGSDPLIDGLLSTDRLQIIHDGARYTRFDKLRAMRDWEVVRRLLRTCYEHPEAFHNCSNCSNCRRTMMVLAAIGVLDEYKTFGPIGSPLHFINTSWKTPHERLFGRQLISHAASNGRVRLAWVGRMAMQTSLVGLGWRKLKVWSRPYRHRLIRRRLS
jgi:hypothetical protein